MQWLEQMQEADIPEHRVLTKTTVAAAVREGRYLRHVVPQHSEGKGCTCPHKDLHQQFFLVLGPVTQWSVEKFNKVVCSSKPET